ncbi:Adenosylcobinamide amidohydrolase [Thermoplasmatales archaeon]|nr:Adenosylcobinamide amidohydrolase [Thermoplasmatales archaeon]
MSDSGYAIERHTDFYFIYFRSPMRRFSSAPFNGGTGTSGGYLNWHVDIDYDGDPALDVPIFLAKNGIDSKTVTVTLTACLLEDFILVEDRVNEYYVTVCMTAGAGNALSIGSAGRDGHGTVNIGVFTDYPAGDPAAINLVQTVVEAKAQAFNDMGIRDRDTGKLSPGTSTDTVSVFVDSRHTDELYGGRLTEIGKKISTIVYENMEMAIKKCKEAL